MGAAMLAREPTRRDLQERELRGWGRDEGCELENAGPTIGAGTPGQRQVGKECKSHLHCQHAKTEVEARVVVSVVSVTIEDAEADSKNEYGQGEH